jgi:hypothetical protein
MGFSPRPFLLFSHKEAHSPRVEHLPVRRLPPLRAAHGERVSSVAHLTRLSNSHIGTNSLKRKVNVTSFFGPNSLRWQQARRGLEANRRRENLRGGRGRLPRFGRWKEMHRCGFRFARPPQPLQESHSLSD